MEEEYDDENVMENIDDEDEEMVNENYKNLEKDDDDKNGGVKNGPPNITIKPPGTKQKRRSKNDSNGRDYVCGCGKTYLSYPALYTHIKTKHNGKTPDGTNANQVQNGRGRGRPRKNFLINDEMMKRGRDRHEGGLEERHPEFKEIYNKRENLGNDYNEEKEEIYLNIFQTLGLLGGPIEPLMGFPDLTNEKFKKSYLPLYNKIKFMLDNNLLNKLLHQTNNYLDAETENEILNQEAAIKSRNNLSCDDILALFLIDNSQIFTFQFYKTLIIFIKSYRDCMNKIGWEIVSQYKEITSEKTEADFTTVRNGEHLPEISEEFVNIYLPNNLPSFDKYLAVVIVNYLCDWAYKHKFTHTKLKYLNEEDDEEIY
jgi:hypothetical protein